MKEETNYLCVLETFINSPPFSSISIPAAAAATTRFHFPATPIPHLPRLHLQHFGLTFAYWTVNIMIYNAFQQ